MEHLFNKRDIIDANFTGSVSYVKYIVDVKEDEYLWCYIENKEYIDRHYEEGMNEESIYGLFSEDIKVLESENNLVIPGKKYVNCWRIK